MTKKAKIGSSPEEIRKFGLLFGAICVALTLFLLWQRSGKWQWFAWGSLFFFGSGLFAHAILRPIYVAWMKFAFALGWINTRILLGIFYYLVLTPTGLFLRFLGKDLLSLKIDRNKQSYWIKREHPLVDPKSAERQF